MTIIAETSTDHVMHIELNDTMVHNKTTVSFVPFIDDEIRDMIVFVNNVIIGQVVALFGMGSNVISILIFYKMGFRESINISLFALAISDFLSCLTVAWGNLCFTPAFYQLDLPFRPLEINFITAAWPHLTFVRITTCLTAFITFERCLCVTFPLKVKNIITPKRVLVFLTFTCVSVIALDAPVYYMSRLAWKFYPNINKTLLGLAFRDARMDIVKWFHPLRGAFGTQFLFNYTIVCTVILVVKLKKSSEWRNKAATTAAASNKSNQVSSRDARVSSLVIFISVVFIVCFTPSSISVMAQIAIPGISIGGKYENFLFVIFSFNFILETVNSSLNIFIYYFRSSKYKATFNHMFFKKAISD